MRDLLIFSFIFSFLVMFAPTSGGALIDIIGGPTESCSPIKPGADLSGCDFYAAIFKNEDLRGVNFTNANLLGADLSGSNLTGADFSFAFMKYTILNNADLSNADLSFVKLIRGEIINANLTNSNFHRATLYRADFTNSDLSNANFSFSILTYANLALTNLQGIDLDNAGTWGTNLNDCINHELCHRYIIDDSKETSSSTLEKTILKLNDLKTSLFDGGQPIVFSGKITTEEGQRIKGVLILIKNNESCSSDRIIAKGLTDKYGKFWIYTIPKVWDSDNVIKIHAEFLGNDQFAPSTSKERTIVVISGHGRNC